MLPTHDTSDVPEARTMIIFLGHLFARLKESTNQIRAAIKIQKFLRLRMFRTTRHNAAVMIQRRFATYIQQRKYGMIICEWRAYKSCCDPSSFQLQENSFESDDFDWEEELARELESDEGNRNARFSPRSDKSIPNLDDERDVSFLEGDPDGHGHGHRYVCLADSQALQLVDIQNTGDEDSAVQHEEEEGVKVGTDDLDKDEEDLDYGNNLSVDSPTIAYVNQDTSYDDDGHSTLKEISVKLQYSLSTDLDVVESTEIISQFLLDRLPMMRLRKLSRGFRRLQVSRTVSAPSEIIAFLAH